MCIIHNYIIHLAWKWGRLFPSHKTYSEKTDNTSSKKLFFSGHAWTKAEFFFYYYDLNNDVEEEIFQQKPSRNFITAKVILLLLIPEREIHSQFSFGL